MPNMVDRFWAKVQKTDGCWQWIGAVSDNGYGRFGQNFAHRFAWELEHGPIPGRHLSNLSLDHLCRNRRCVRPAHMELVTQRENILRGRLGVLKTACIHGHPYPENQRIRRTTGTRFCIACRRLADRARYPRRKV